MIEQLKTIRSELTSLHGIVGDLSEALTALTQLEAMVGQQETLTRIVTTENQEPMFWVRLCSDGMYEGPIHNAQIERVRAQSGAWSPLFLGSAPVAQQYEAGDVASAAAQGFRDGVASVTQQEPVAWRDPSNSEPGQGCTYDKAVADKWPHIYKQPLYAAPVAQQPPAMPMQCKCFDEVAKKYCADKGKCSQAVAQVAQQPQAEVVQHTRADLDRAYSAGLVEGERLAIQQAEAVPVAVVKYQVGGLVVHIVGDVQEGDELFKTPQQAEAVPPDVARDAAAYHWLTTTLTSPEPWVVFQKAFGHMTEERPPTKAELDAAIYAAIAQQKGGV